MEPLPAGWVARESSSHPGRPYYFNTATQESVWERPVGGSVRASHILVKHAGSRRPSSWREERITCSKAEALAKLSALRSAIVSGAQAFADVARVESDCSSAAKGGDLGVFGRGQMQKPFEDAAYGLKVRGVSWAGAACTAPSGGVPLRALPEQLRPANARVTRGLGVVW